MKTPRKPREAAPANESKSEKFSRLASKRVTKAVNAIKNIGQLASRSYEYTPGQASEIGRYLNEAVEHVRKRFAEPSAPAAGPTIKI